MQKEESSGWQLKKKLYFALVELDDDDDDDEVETLVANAFETS